MKEWQWDELGQDLVQWTDEDTRRVEEEDAKCGWSAWRTTEIIWERGKLIYKEERSDRNHLSLRTVAETRKKAHENFMKHPEYRECMGPWYEMIEGIAEKIQGSDLSKFVELEINDILKEFDDQGDIPRFRVAAILIDVGRAME